jgi:hypothetical protein
MVAIPREHTTMQVIIKTSTKSKIDQNPHTCTGQIESILYNRLDTLGRTHSGSGMPPPAKLPSQTNSANHSVREIPQNRPRTQTIGESNGPSSIPSCHKKGPDLIWNVGKVAVAEHGRFAVCLEAESGVREAQRCLLEQSQQGSFPVQRLPSPKLLFVG